MIAEWDEGHTVARARCMVGIVAGREGEKGLLEGADAQRGSHAREQCRTDKRRILQVEPFIISQHEEGQPRILLTWTSQSSLLQDTVSLHVVAWLGQCHGMVLSCCLLPMGHKQGAFTL